MARSYHIRHFVFAAGVSAFKPYPPRPEQSLVFYPRQKEIVEYTTESRTLCRPPAMVMNQYTARTNRHIANDFLVIIVELQPGILHRIMGEALRDFTNIDLDATLIMPSQFSLVTEQLQNTDDYGVMIAVIEQLLARLWKSLQLQSDPVDKAAKYVLNQDFNVSIDWLARQSCLSVRQFERKFRSRIGVGPKTYARLTRLHQTHMLKSQSPGLNWLDIALRCGYHDYQHLAKDYQEFAGCSPNELLNQQGMSPERLFSIPETFALPD